MTLLYLLGILLLFGSTMRTIYFLFINCKLIIRESWAEAVEQNQLIIQQASQKGKYQKTLKIKESDDIIDLTREEKRKLMFVRGPYFKPFEKKEDVVDFNDNILSLEYYFKCLIFIWRDSEVRSVLMYNLICFCGLWFSELFYCLLLIYLAVII